MLSVIYELRMESSADLVWQTCAASLLNGTLWVAYGLVRAPICSA